MSKLTVRELLKGTVTGNLQTVGAMQVIPLLSDIEFNDYVSPKQAGKFGTNSYGSMNFQNDSDKKMIIPSNATYMTKHAAQDHGMMHAGIICKKMTKTYDTAACVQQTQAGHIPMDNHEFVIMPFSLREKSHAVRKERSYNKMWPAIIEFNTRTKSVQNGYENRGHLEFFFKKFEKELEEFAAEFETVPKQVGAIILINGTVVGIERAPNYDYWKSIWSQLIRGCYGSLAIENQQTGKVDNASVEKIRTKLSITGITTFDQLEKELTKTELSQKDKVAEIVRDLIDEEFVSEVDETTNNNVRIHVKNTQFLGQIISEDKAIIYFSLIANNGWVKNSKWHKAKEFTI